MRDLHGTGIPAELLEGVEQETIQVPAIRDHQDPPGGLELLEQLGPHEEKERFPAAGDSPNKPDSQIAHERLLGWRKKEVCRHELRLQQV